MAAGARSRLAGSSGEIRVERLQVQAFLKTLVAPASAGSPEVSLAVEEDARAVQQELQRPRDEAVSRQPTCSL